MEKLYNTTLYEIISYPTSYLALYILVMLLKLSLSLLKLYVQKPPIYIMEAGG